MALGSAAVIHAALRPDKGEPFNRFPLAYPMPESRQGQHFQFAYADSCGMILGSKDVPTIEPKTKLAAYPSTRLGRHV
jgi:hypothetical protein